MGYYRIDAGVARLMKLGLEHELPARVEAWNADLDQGRLTDEMRQVFAGMGWLSSLRDGRLQAVAESDPGPIATTRRRRQLGIPADPAQQEEAAATSTAEVSGISSD